MVLGGHIFVNLFFNSIRQKVVMAELLSLEMKNFIPNVIQFHLFTISTYCMCFAIRTIKVHRILLFLYVSFHPGSELNLKNIREKNWINIVGKWRIGTVQRCQAKSYDRDEIIHTAQRSQEFSKFSFMHWISNACSYSIILHLLHH
jgi:hypothetical protein